MKIDILNYEHFSFDVWLTIIKSNPDFKTKRDDLFKDFFDLKNPSEEIKNKIRFYDVLVNQISEKTGRHFFRQEIILLILASLNKDISDINQTELNDFFKELDDLFLKNPPFLLWENIENILKEIKNQGKTSSILSNTAFIHGNIIREILEKFNILDYFSFVVFSDEVCISKPNSKIFELVYNKINQIKSLEKKQIIHIGDNKIADYNSAIKFGFNAQIVKF